MFVTINPLSEKFREIGRRSLAGVLFILLSFGCAEPVDRDQVAFEKLSEIADTFEPVLDIVENFALGGNENQRLEQAIVVLREFVTDPVSFMEDPPAVAEQVDSGDEGGDDFLTQTLYNFGEYILEETAWLAAEGADMNMEFPQIDYEAFLGEIPLVGFLGFAAVLPELLTSDGDALLGEVLAPFTLPVLPVDLRLSHHIPEVPAIDRKVIGTTEDDGFTNPHIPPLRLSADGRLGVASQVGGTVADPEPVSLYLLAPEKLAQPFVESAPGPQALALDEWTMEMEELTGGREGIVQHTNLCDPFTGSDRPNPYSCGQGGKDDCYDLTLVSAYAKNGFEEPGGYAPMLDKDTRLMGTPLTIRVTDPKTPDAGIAAIEYGSPTFSERRTSVLFETITPADGRLLIARRAFMPLVWKNRANGRAQFGSYDIVYGVAPESADACDVTYWDELLPITHAPYDPRVKDRYVFAKQPFRDAGGALVPDGVDIKGTYPWMDKEAKMLSMQVGPGHLFPYGTKNHSRYPYRCYSGSCTDLSILDTDNSKDNMFMIVGAWTQGKMVLLDGLLNNTDFRLRGENENLLHLGLYQANTGPGNTGSGEVLVGATRQVMGLNPPVHDEDGGYQGSYHIRNTSMFDSIENRFNYLQNLKPGRFQDVNWNMSSGQHTVEFAFDDYLNPDAFIVSNMVAYFEHKNGHFYRMSGYDGWHQGLRSFSGQVKVQNSATAPYHYWRVPGSGRVVEGRMEPVANGGIRGKGLWLNGSNSYVEYDIPGQARNVHDESWFYSLFVDPRFGDDGELRTLIRFPDKSKMRLAGRQAVVLVNSWNQEVVRVPLAEPLTEKAWSHLAMLVEPGDEHGIRRIRIYQNGYPVFAWNGAAHNTNLEHNNFRPVAGKLRIGDSLLGNGLFGQGIRGWVDEFKVFAQKPNPEMICNFGHGSLVGLPEGYSGEWSHQADRYANASHESTGKVLSAYGQATYDRYACYHDYTKDNGAHLNNLPAGTVSLREAFHFPEGPLYFNAPRPDSSHNDFCLSCHNDVNVTPGLKMAALTLNTDYPAMLDPRRQPTQPPAKVYGNIPAAWFAGAPGNAFVTGSDGAYIDEWLLANAELSYPEIRNLALVDGEGEAVRGIYSGDELSSAAVLADYPGIRANVNGLVRRVEFTINGGSYTDEEAPFEFDSSLLKQGTNNITVEAADDRGRLAAVTFTLKAGEWQWGLSGTQGGDGGHEFNDARQFNDNPPDITRVELKGGIWIDRVSFHYNDGSVLEHGGSGGHGPALDLQAGEYITSVKVCAANLGFFERLATGISRLVHRVEVSTNHGRHIAAGPHKGDCSDYTAPGGQKITGWHGRSALFVDRLGVIYAAR